MNRLIILLKRNRTCGWIALWTTVFTFLNFKNWYSVLNWLENVRAFEYLKSRWSPHDERFYMSIRFWCCIDYLWYLLARYKSIWLINLWRLEHFSPSSIQTLRSCLFFLLLTLSLSLLSLSNLHQIVHKSSEPPLKLSLKNDGTKS